MKEGGSLHHLFIEMDYEGVLISIKTPFKLMNVWYLKGLFPTFALQINHFMSNGNV